MTIKSSGQLSLGEIMNEFGWPAVGDRRLGRFYRGGGLVPNNGANGAISTGGGIRIGMFYGAKRTVPFSLEAMRTTYSLDAGMEIWVHFAIGQIEMRWQYFNRGGGRIWNYTTTAGANGNDVYVPEQVDEYGTVISPASYQSEIIYSGGLYQSNPYAGGDNRNFIWKDGIGTSFAKPDIADYSSLYMGVELNTLNGGRSTLSGAVQPSAANGYVGYCYISDQGKNSGPGSVIIRLDGS